MLAIDSQITRTYLFSLVPQGSGPDFTSVALAGSYRAGARLQEIFPALP
jgi:hypothetical protein